LERRSRRNPAKIPVIKRVAKLLGLEQVFAHLFFSAANHEFQFIQIRRPAEAVEKLGAFELGFVERISKIARS
jgi:hypothetical protein